MRGASRGRRLRICEAYAMSRKLYGIFVSGLVPRPVAFVSSISEDGVENLAPFRCALRLHLK